jgi:hypothetical protein
MRSADGDAPRLAPPCGCGGMTHLSSQGGQGPMRISDSAPLYALAILGVGVVAALGVIVVLFRMFELKRQSNFYCNRL